MVLVQPVSPWKSRVRRAWVVLLAVAGVLALTAGSCDGLGDAPIGEQYEAPRTILVMPDKFPNLALVCDGSTAIYVTTREAAPAVVPNSAYCRSGEIPASEGESGADNP